MVISYLGAYCIKAVSGDLTLAFNPPSKESGFKAPRFRSDIVLVSEDRKEFNGWKELAGRDEKGPFVIDGPGEYEVKGVYILGAANGENTIYLAKIEDITLCHLGDFKESDLTPESKELIGMAEILFVPVEDEKSAKEAVKITSFIEPNIIVPLSLNGSKKGLKAFVEEFKNGSSEPQDKLAVKKKDLPQKKLEVIILKH